MQGPINSWDRQPYVTLVYDGTPSARMLPRNISNNFLVGNCEWDVNTPRPLGCNDAISPFIGRRRLERLRRQR